MLICDKLLLQQDNFCLTVDVMFNIGKIMVLIGFLGVGKFILLAVLAGFLALVLGWVMWQDMDLIVVLLGVRLISVIFQDNNLFLYLTIV